MRPGNARLWPGCQCRVNRRALQPGDDIFPTETYRGLNLYVRNKALVDVTVKRLGINLGPGLYLLDGEQFPGRPLRGIFSSDWFRGLLGCSAWRWTSVRLLRLLEKIDNCNRHRGAWVWRQRLDAPERLLYRRIAGCEHAQAPQQIQTVLSRGSSSCFPRRLSSGLCQSGNALALPLSALELGEQLRPIRNQAFQFGDGAFVELSLHLGDDDRVTFLSAEELLRRTTDRHAQHSG